MDGRGYCLGLGCCDHRLSDRLLVQIRATYGKGTQSEQRKCCSSSLRAEVHAKESAVVHRSSRPSSSLQAIESELGVFELWTW